MSAAKILTESQVVRLLAQHITATGLTDAAWCAANGVPAGQLSRMRNHHRPPTQRVLVILGLQRARAYRRIPKR
jgi:hypothetical protein